MTYTISIRGQSHVVELVPAAGSPPPTKGDILGLLPAELQAIADREAVFITRTGGGGDVRDFQVLPRDSRNAPLPAWF